MYLSIATNSKLHISINPAKNAILKKALHAYLQNFKVSLDKERCLSKDTGSLIDAKIGPTNKSARARLKINIFVVF